MAKEIDSLMLEAEGLVKSMSCKEYLAMKDDTAHVLIDVREQDEWDDGHMNGAIHIPRGFLEFKIEELVPDKNAVIVLYCAHGPRSVLCGRSLQKMGYTHISYIEDGYIACMEGIHE